MRITVADMERAGSAYQKMSFSDEELTLLVKSISLTLGFLNRAGPKWALAAIPLRHKLIEFEDLVDARKK